MPRLIWVLLGLCACTSTTPPPKPEAKPETPTKVEAKTEPKPDETQWRCTKDEECTQTCALGAVNVEWLRAHENADACDDGCSWKGAQVACRDGGCVTLTKDGDIDGDCTRREKPIFE